VNLVSQLFFAKITFNKNGFSRIYHCNSREFREKIKIASLAKLQKRDLWQEISDFLRQRPVLLVLFSLPYSNCPVLPVLSAYPVLPVPL
jgi:hypothetical protein